MVQGMFSSHKGRLMCLGVLVWLAFGIAFAALNSGVFFQGITAGTISFDTLSGDNLTGNQPINGIIHDVVGEVTYYYTDFIDVFKLPAITDSNNIYIVPIDDKGNNVLVTVKRDSKTDIEFRSMIRTKENDTKNSEIFKKGIWIDAVGVKPKVDVASIVQDPVNDKNGTSIKVYNYIVDCTHPYSVTVIVFSLGVLLLISLFIAIIILIKRIKAVVLADEHTIKESYLAANRTPPGSQGNASTEYNPNIRTDSDDGEYSTTRIFDSSTRNINYDNSAEISFGKFQRQGDRNNDKNTE